MLAYLRYPAGNTTNGYAQHQWCRKGAEGDVRVSHWQAPSVLRNERAIVVPKHHLKYFDQCLLGVWSGMLYTAVDGEKLLRDATAW